MNRLINLISMKDFKYLFAYTIPLSSFFSFHSSGIWTYSAVFYAFLVIPILDVLTENQKIIYLKRMQIIRRPSGFLI